MSEDLGLVWLHVVSPPDMEADLASVSENWGNFGGASEEKPDLGSTGAERNTRANLNAGRQARFEEWIEAIQPGRRPSLNFKHTLLPHVPWQYLPDARRYRRQANDAIPGLSNQSFEYQSPAGRAARAPLPPDRLRRPRAAGSSGSTSRRRGCGTSR